jgi:hypothetical protein
MILAGLRLGVLVPSWTFLRRCTSLVRRLSLVVVVSGSGHYHTFSQFLIDLGSIDMHSISIRFGVTCRGVLIYQLGLRWGDQAAKDVQ